MFFSVDELMLVILGQIHVSEVSNPVPMALRIDYNVYLPLTVFIDQCYRTRVLILVFATEIFISEPDPRSDSTN